MAKAAKITTDDKRIEAIALLIEKGYIKTWAGIFDYIPRTVVANHLGLNNNKMKLYVEAPALLPADKLEQIASFLKVKITVLEGLRLKAKPAKSGNNK